MNLGALGAAGIDHPFGIDRLRRERLIAREGEQAVRQRNEDAPAPSQASTEHGAPQARLHRPDRLAGQYDHRQQIVTEDRDNCSPKIPANDFSPPTLNAAPSALGESVLLRCRQPDFCNWHEAGGYCSAAFLPLLNELQTELAKGRDSGL
jgi:hypothetical protein